MEKLKNKLDDIFCEVDRHYYSGVIEPFAGKELLKMIQEAIDYIPCCTELKAVDITEVEDMSDPYWKEYIDGK